MGGEQRIKIYNDDCINHFKKVKEKSIDLFVLDLPYANKKFGNCTDCKWDTPVDLEEMWQQIKRIMKPNAVIVHFCNVKFGYALIHSNPKWFSYQLIWKKSKKVGFLACNKKPLVNHENIYIFKDKQGTYNPQKTEGKEYKSKVRIEKQGVYRVKEGYIRTATKDTKMRHPTSIIENDKIENTILEYNNPYKPIHHTQKPVDLLEYLIKTFSNENDTIMDFCMGSGSTGIACMNTKRKFIGVEKDIDIFNLTKNRIKNHRKDIKKGASAKQI